MQIGVDGVIAGLIGGAVIAAWFFLFDAINGRPLWTPAMLAQIFFHSVRRPDLMTGGAWFLVAQYTAFHFLAFAIIGAVGALLVAASRDDRELFLPLLIFAIGFEVFFIALLMLMGPAAADALPWWKVLAGNLMATTAMFAYFFWREPDLAQSLFGPWVGVVREGVVSGILGAIVVALWFLIADFFAGRPFHTPALLGAIIFSGLQQTGPVTPTLALVLGYTVLHFFAFIMFGIVASITMAASEREPLVALGVLVLFMWFEVSFVSFVGFLNQRAMQDLGIWNLIGGNLTALAVIIAYYEYGHPRVLPRLTEQWRRVRDEQAARRRDAQPAHH
jgi:hypothetical protein